MKKKLIASLLACGMLLSVSTGVMAAQDTANVVNQEGTKTVMAKSSPTTDMITTGATVTTADGKTEEISADDLKDLFKIYDTDTNKGIQETQTLSEKFDMVVPEGYKSITLTIEVKGVKAGTEVWFYQLVDGKWISVKGRVVADNQIELTVSRSGVINMYIKKVGQWESTTGGKQYIYNDNTVATNKWLNFDGTWYRCNDKGYMQIGWYKERGIWYYMNKKNGVMETGWQTIDGANYFLKENGKMATKWQKVNNKWYYFKENGKRSSGWRLVDGRWFYMHSDGIMKTGWLRSKGKWYLLKENGAMATGWVKQGNSWYYLNKDGSMQIGWYKDGDERWFYLKQNGEMATGWTFDGKATYFLNSNGVWNGQKR